MKNYKIHLIRHGSTAANENGIYCGGGTDLPLSENGRAQLCRLLEDGLYPYLDELYVSPMRRAAETAELLYPGMSVTAVEGLREAGFGHFEGRSIEELKGDPLFQKWVSPTSKFTPQGVEPPADFFARCIAAFSRIVNHMTESGIYSVGIITHASVIGNIMAGVCLPKHPPYDWQCQPGGGFTVMTNAMLWMQGGVCEAAGELPFYEEPPAERDEFSFYE